MGTLAPIIGSLGLLTLIVGGLMFLPLRALKSRRPLAKKLAIGGGVAFIIGVIFTPTPPASTKSPASVATQEPGASASSTPSPSPTASDVASAAAKDEFIQRYRQMLAAAKVCDEASETLGKAANSGSQLATYQAAQGGRDACRAAAGTIGELDAPEDLPDAGEAAFDKAKDTCRNAYIYRQLGMEKAMQAADGDARPSVVSEMQENMKTGQAGTLLCVAQWFDAAGKSGIDVKALD